MHRAQNDFQDKEAPMKKLLNIFIPEELNGYYPLGSTLVGVTIKTDAVHATVAVLSGKTITLKKTVSVPLENTQEQTATTIAPALTALFAQVGSYDHVITSLSSSFVTFKHLSFPFSDTDKIGMVIPHQIESLLPFSPTQACIDFITAPQKNSQDATAALAAAVQQKLIHETLTPFEQAGIAVSRITTDAIGLYGLCMRDLLFTTGLRAFVAVDQTTTTIGLVKEGQLKQIRTLRKGSLAGIESPALWKEIKFTLQAFMDEEIDATLEQIILFGNNSEKLTQLCQESQSTPCKAFDLNSWCAATGISTKLENSAVEIISLACAVPLTSKPDFSFLPSRAVKGEQTGYSRSVMVGLSLPVIILSLLSVHAFRSIRLFSQEFETSQKQILKTLKENFPAITSNNVRDALDMAQREVKREEDIWSSLSSQNRQSFLHYLHELNTKIDRETLGLNLTKMIISKNILTLEGSVRSFEAVEQFEYQLRETQLFSTVPDMQKIEFSVPLPLKLQRGA